MGVHLCYVLLSEFALGPLFHFHPAVHLVDGVRGGGDDLSPFLRRAAAGDPGYDVGTGRKLAAAEIPGKGFDNAQSSIFLDFYCRYNKNSQKLKLKWRLFCNFF